MFGLFSVFIQLKFLTIWKFPVIHPAFQKFWHVCEGKKTKSLKSTAKEEIWEIGRNISTDGQLLLRTRISSLVDSNELVWELLPRDYRRFSPHPWLCVCRRETRNCVIKMMIVGFTIFPPVIKFALQHKPMSGKLLCVLSDIIIIEINQTISLVICV